MNDGDCTSQVLWSHLRHELRTPLNAIIGYSEILLENAAEQEQEEIIPDLEKIHAAGKLFLARLNNIIDFSNFDAGLKSPPWEPRISRL